MFHWFCCIASSQRWYLKMTWLNSPSKFQMTESSNIFSEMLAASCGALNLFSCLTASSSICKFVPFIVCFAFYCLPPPPSSVRKSATDLTRWVVKNGSVSPFCLQWSPDIHVHTYTWCVKALVRNWIMITGFDSFHTYFSYFPNIWGASRPLLQLYHLSLSSIMKTTRVSSFHCISALL